MDKRMNSMDIFQMLDYGQPKDVVLRELETNMQVDSLVHAIRNEVPRLREIAQQLRPLLGERHSLNEKIIVINLGIDMDVALEYPPRKGTDAQRQMMKNELQQKSEAYKEAQAQIRILSEQIDALTYEKNLIEQEAKNARRLLETHEQYVEYITKR